ncbi:MAG: NAD(+) diphosphatase [Cyanobacteria bacterium J06631_9]
MQRPNPFAISDQFEPATQPDTSRDNTLSQWWFICQGSSLLILSNSAGNSSIPQAKSTKTLGEALGIEPVRTQFLGYLAGHPCIGAELAKTAEIPKGLSLQNLRTLHGVLPDDLFAIAARAIQIIEWDRTHQYCGHCATPMTQLPTERAKRCPSCQHRQYPQLSPAVIMLIYRGDDVLLARAPRFRPGMYSVLAGFVEPGESLEETVAREVKEEVGIEIKNIQYFGSQPWPFPKSLMVGFTAEYASGTITPEPLEIEAAAWFGRHKLPPVPGKLSIARRLIDWFVEK